MPNSFLRLFAVAIAIAVGFALLPPAAQAQGKKRVVVLPFSGDKARAARARKTVRRVLDQRYRLASASRYGQERRKRRSYAKAARAVDVDAIVLGKVTGKGRNARLRIAVREGRTGTTVGSFEVPMPRRVVRRTAIERRLVRLIDQARGPRSAQDRQDDDSDDSGDEVAEDDGELDELDGDEAVDDDEDLGDDELDNQTERRDDGAVRRGPDGPAATVRAGLSVLTRDLRFDYDATLAPAQRPTIYDGSPVGGFNLQAELYPAWWLRDKPRRLYTSFGIAFELERAIGLRSQFETDGTQYEFSTTQSRWGIGARYRRKLGRVLVKGGLGFNRLSHTVERDMAVDTGLPNVAYSYIDIGVGAELPVARKIDVTAKLAYLAVVSAGELVEQEYYGQATVSGIDVDAGGRYALTETIDLRAGIRYSRVALDFNGSGDMTTNLDGDPDQEVTGATDSYLAGYALAEYSF